MVAMALLPALTGDVSDTNVSERAGRGVGTGVGLGVGRGVGAAVGRVVGAGVGVGSGVGVGVAVEVADGLVVGVGAAATADDNGWLGLGLTELEASEGDPGVARPKVSAPTASSAATPITIRCRPDACRHALRIQLMASPQVPQRYNGWSSAQPL